MREVVRGYRWGRHALLAAAAWLGIVTAVAGYFLWADGVEAYSFRALFVALVLVPAAIALMVYALSFYNWRRVGAVALSLAARRAGFSPPPLPVQAKIGHKKPAH
jgi:hypothetical protein